MNNPYYEPYWTCDNELEHHGILGMKWGIRRFQNKDGSLTSAGKKRYSGPKSIRKGTRPVSIKGQRYNKDITIPVGTAAYRIQATNKLNKKGPMYISLDRHDHKELVDTVYLVGPDGGVAIDAFTPENPDTTTYSMELKTTKELKAPSYQHAMETFVEMVGDVGIDSINPYDKQWKSGQWFVESFLNSGKWDLGPDYSYTEFVNNMQSHANGKFYEEFRKRLVDKGYNALVDPKDRGYSKKDEHHNSNAPFILLDSSAVKISKTTKLNDFNVDEWLEKWK